MVSLLDPRASNPVLSSLKIKTEDKIIFIRENSLADSNFIITHLLKQFLYDKGRVCFLTLHNTFDHYQNVGKKLGYDLKQMVERGDMKIIDPLQDIVENMMLESCKNRPKSQQILQVIFNSIKTEINTYLSTTGDHRPVYLVIDDLSHFLDLGIDLSAIVNFTNICMNFTSSEVNVSIVINSHVSSKSDLILANNIQYVCDVFVCVSALKTGKSTDITGLMTVHRGQNENRFHYRAFDRGVKTFHPGDTIYNLYK